MEVSTQPAFSQQIHQCESNQWLHHIKLSANIYAVNCFFLLICVISIITREFTVSFGIFPPYLTTTNAHDYQDYTCSFLGFPLLLAVRLDLKVEIKIKNHVSAAPQTCKTSCLACAYSCAVGNSDLSTTSWWNNTTCFDHATVETILHQLLCQKSVL